MTIAVNEQAVDSQGQINWESPVSLETLSVASNVVTFAFEARVDIDSLGAYPLGERFQLTNYPEE